MLEHSDKLEAILVSLLLLAQACGIRLVLGTFIFPASLMSLAWFFYTFVPLILLFSVPVNPLSVLYILSCVSAFSLSALPFNWRKAYQANRMKARYGCGHFDSRFMRWLLYIASFSSLFCSTISVTSNGIELKALILHFMTTSGQYAARRGQGELGYGVWGILSIFFTYATPALYGLVSRSDYTRVKKWLLVFVAFGPSVYYMLTQSAKLAIFFSLGFYYAGVLLKKIYSNELTLFKWSSLLRSTVFALILLPLLLISFTTRQGFPEVDGVGELVRELSPRVNSYALAQVYAFSDFFSSYLGRRSESTYVHDFNSYGYYTFKSLRDMLGGEKYFPPGTFLDGYYYKEVVSTNIFTIFRGLIYDFGGIGAVCVMFAGGLVVHALFYRLLTARRSWFACGAFIITVVFIEGTYLFSVFMARYMYLLFVAFVVMLWVNDWYVRTQRLRRMRRTVHIPEVLPATPPSLAECS